MLSCVFEKPCGKTSNWCHGQGLAPIQCASIRNRNSGLCYWSERLSRLRCRVVGPWLIKVERRLYVSTIIFFNCSWEDNYSYVIPNYHYNIWNPFASISYHLLQYQFICSNISASESSFSSMNVRQFLAWILLRLKTSDGGSQSDSQCESAIMALCRRNWV